MKNSLSVFFYEAFAEEEHSLRACLPPEISADFTWKSIQEAGHAVPPAALISIRTQSVVPAAWTRSLHGILSRSAGYDHVADWLKKNPCGIKAGYLPEYCVRAVAEQAALLWMSLLRKLPQQQRQFPVFLRDGITGRECAGKTLLVTGVGRIGYEIARIGQALNMRVYGVDIVEKHSDISYMQIDEGLRQADVVVCSMNLTAENHGYFSYERLSQCRPGVVFVNIARGEMSPPVDLLRLLDEGIAGGVALDVYPEEPRISLLLRSGQPSDDPLVRVLREIGNRPNAVLTPHNAFNTEESVEQKSRQSVQQTVHFLNTGSFLWPVPG
ncbi:MAG TPA: NAD(P)-dependent oxidoreductase [Kiritimatiellia bacterium]|nr:NAD(P)-dependent oxidoreductase [Kiritimatiellia bacterium]HNS81212.1 NAD(P)-dependent oxidoreductase [Kiritimatiellia bacterium]HPA77500.1 NAD(P)-dependent oxidoreductase [Kiritimatiellia bacterium]HQQ03463.1 NAD(P)-dependent oxidoreductase [Kiritimatiellia bacterium]